QWQLDMEARLRTLDAMRIVQGTESKPQFTDPLDSGERRELRDYNSRVDAAAGEIWNCVEREQQTHLEAIRDDPGAMWRKLESVHMQKRPGTRGRQVPEHPVNVSIPAQVRHEGSASCGL
ncbi:hypothetical protein OH77DRAFT_1431597, partial [Trametes cingulata]